jgi:hypothetical protein
MSRPAKLTLLGTTVFSGLVIVGVHYLQREERAVCLTSFKLVPRDPDVLCPCLSLPVLYLTTARTEHRVHRAGLSGV